MAVLLPLDTLLLLLSGLTYIGVGWVSALCSWLWSHAAAVGLVLLVLYAVYLFGTASVAREDFGAAGVLCTVVHGALSVAVVMAEYKTLRASVISFGYPDVLEWLILSLTLTLTEFIFTRGADPRKGVSLPRLFVGTAGSSLVAALALWIIVRAGGTG